METIQEHKDALNSQFTNMENKREKIQRVLNDALENITFLESMYQTGGKYHVFSDRFSEQAYQERQALCLLTSACYSILREMQP